MMRLLLFIIWIISSSVIWQTTSRPVFGVRVSIGANSQITSYVCYLYNGRTLNRKRIVDKASFVKIVTGHWPSIYNPQRIDLFKENNIDCALLTDSITMKKVVGCVPMDSLWKIRFSIFPFVHNSDIGWSNKYNKPSQGQEKYLSKRYGIDHIDGDYFLDTNFWKIMQDVVDPIWVNNYKSIR